MGVPAGGWEGSPPSRSSWRMWAKDGWKRRERWEKLEARVLRVQAIWILAGKLEVLSDGRAGIEDLGFWRSVILVQRWR